MTRRTLFFDLNGCLLRYPDYTPKPALTNNVLGTLLKTAEFDRLVCVSSYVLKMKRQGIAGTEMRRRLCMLLKPMVYDQQWLICRLELLSKDPHYSALHLLEDFFVLDDRSHLRFPIVFGEVLYRRYLGERILQVDPDGDGDDIVAFLARVTKR